LKTIAFDLDDTLLDTSRLLVPKAAKESCLAMINAGLKTDIETCLQVREKLARGRGRRDLYKDLVTHFGALPHGKSPGQIEQCGREAFHNREVESDISLFTGAEQILQALNETYTLYLVTAGHRPTQEAKIRILGIEKYFKQIFHVDPSLGETKNSAFAAIMLLPLQDDQQIPTPANQFLSVGNRLDTDIGEARQLGWKGCWIRHGEYSHLEPDSEFEKPDFIIDDIKDLIITCQL
jgi:putative hydrolase of the HAD superfamily